MQQRPRGVRTVQWVGGVALAITAGSAWRSLLRQFGFEMAVLPIGTWQGNGRTPVHFSVVSAAAVTAHNVLRCSCDERTHRLRSGGFQGSTRPTQGGGLGAGSCVLNGAAFCSATENVLFELLLGLWLFIAPLLLRFCVSGSWAEGTTSRRWGGRQSLRTAGCRTKALFVDLEGESDEMFAVTLTVKETKKGNVLSACSLLGNNVN